ncbi:hypothetical protein ACVWW8_002690, partial [Thermostichus sp. MS-CIW-22]
SIIVGKRHDNRSLTWASDSARGKSTVQSLQPCCGASGCSSHFLAKEKEKGVGGRSQEQVV